MTYHWQQADWPHFTYNTDAIEDALFDFTRQTGYVSGLLQTMPEGARREAVIDTMATEALNTSEIEGEHLNHQDIVSSIRNNLGLNDVRDPVRDKRAQGAGELMVDVRRSYAEPLTAEKLFAWHAMLLGRNRRVLVGTWRRHDDPMQVVSGALGKEKIHFEAPPSSRVPDEMRDFIRWFNDTAPGGAKEIKKAPLRSAIAHLYFETIHPFEDGNGRIGRAIAEKALSQTLDHPVLLSLSRVIERDKAAYYHALEQAQKSSDITAWLGYFVGITIRAQEQAGEMIDFIVRKAQFFNRFKDSLNERQLKVVQRMLDSGPEGFAGGMSARKYIAITKISKATATRDLQNLVELGVLVLSGGGRNAHYDLNLGGDLPVSEYS